MTMLWWKHHHQVDINDNALVKTPPSSWYKWQCSGENTTIKLISMTMLWWKHRHQVDEPGQRCGENTTIQVDSNVNALVKTPPSSRLTKTTLWWERWRGLYQLEHCTAQTCPAPPSYLRGDHLQVTSFVKRTLLPRLNFSCAWCGLNEYDQQ